VRRIDFSKDSSLYTISNSAFKVENLKGDNRIYVYLFTKISKINCLLGHMLFVDFNQSIESNIIKIIK
jgi:hypothetical protein